MADDKDTKVVERCGIVARTEKEQEMKARIERELATTQHLEIQKQLKEELGDEDE